VFLGEVKARPKDIISFSLDYNKQKLSTDKQSVIKPHFTRHAGKAGGFYTAILRLPWLVSHFLSFIFSPVRNQIRRLSPVQAASRGRSNMAFFGQFGSLMPLGILLTS